MVAAARALSRDATVAESEEVEPAGLHLAMLLERRGPADLSPDDHDLVLRDRSGRTELQRG